MTRDIHERQTMALFYYWIEQERNPDISPIEQANLHMEQHGTDIYGFAGMSGNRPCNGWADHIVVIKHGHDNGGISSIYHLVGFHRLRCASSNRLPLHVFRDGALISQDEIDFFYMHIEQRSDTGATLRSWYAQSWYEDGENVHIEDSGYVTECFYFFLEHATLISEKTFVALHPAIPSQIIRNPILSR